MLSFKLKLIWALLQIKLGSELKYYTQSNPKK